MPDNNVDPISTSLRDLDYGIAAQNAEIDRLLSQAFVNHARAQRGLWKIIRPGAEHAAHIIQKDDLRRWFYFGQTRDGFFSSNRMQAQAALRELPQAITRLGELTHRRDDLRRAPSFYRPSVDLEPVEIRPRDRARARSRGR